MKKILVALALAAFASTASATIAGGPHDMTQAPYSGTKGTCQYCHAPHLWVASNIAVGNAAAPLWNRDFAGSVTPYGTTVLGTTVGQPGARSQTCLSCHDGRTNVGVVNNGVDETLAAIAAGVNVGTVMTNDHPVGTPIPASTEYQSPGTATGIILASSNVECASCHEPHNNAGSFLRATGAAICSACHIK